MQMRQLFSQEQFEVRRTIETIIAHHIQPLSIAIEAMTEIQNQVFELRAVSDVLIVNPVPTQSHCESRSEEVFIEGCGQKSKAGAVSVVQTIML